MACSPQREARGWWPRAARVSLVFVAAALLMAGQNAAVAQEPETATVRVRGESESTSEQSTTETQPEPEGAADGATESAEADFAKVAASDVPVVEPVPPVPSNGEIIVGFAYQYLGYPYVWAGNTPAGFDCSGFTQWVILNTLGIDIGHGIEGQPAAGPWVDWGAWLPGDIVFFQNTYRAGISHVGIYVGDGLFIHAENEGTGVVVSSMYSDYYGPRYWGAVRVG